MAITIPSKMDAARGVILNVLGVSSERYDSAFDSYLILKNGCQNHTLTLTLKIHFNKVSTYGMKVFPHADADGNLFWIKPWDSASWQSFENKFKRQAYMWNDRFWLKPPANFSKLDVKMGSRTVRPNIYCHLYVHLESSPAQAHRSIEVVNLHKKLTAQIQNVRESDLDSGNFRSHEELYDSLDTTPRQNTITDDKGVRRRQANYLTVVHEIGHAIGLPHIGVSHKDPLCGFATFVDESGLPNTGLAGTIFEGGRNASVCTGHFAPRARGENVMGGGRSFDSTNAQPWLDRIALHTGTNAADWSVSVGAKNAPAPRLM